MAFELSEMSRSRTFLDTLDEERGPLPVSANQFVARREILTTRHDLLIRLTDLLKMLGKNYVDFEILERLRVLDNPINVTTQMDEGRIIIDGVRLIEELDKLNKDIENVDEQIEQARYAEMNDIAGKVVSFTDAKRMLIDY